MFNRLILCLAILSLVFVCLTPTLAVASSAAHSADQAAEGEASPTPLAWQSNLAIWTGVVFLILLFVLWRFAWGPIADGLHKRETRIADDIASADRINEEAKQLLASYEEKLARANEDVRQLLDKARRDAADISRQIVDKAREDAEAEHRQALLEIDHATSAALKDLAERSATLAVDLAGRIVGSRLEPRDHSQLIQQAVERFAQAKPNGH